jgi:hypothetical protein
MRDFEPTYDQVWPLAPIPFIRSEPRQVRSTLDTGPKVEVERPLFGATTGPMHCSKNHSTTSSARASSVGGTSSPSAFAVWRLMTSSNLVAC